MGKRQYSDNEKGAALAFVDFKGGNTREASKVLGIPHTTLQDWLKERGTNEDVTEIRTEKKEEISTLIEAAVRDMVGASKDKIGTANFQQLWTGVGIAVDKMQLLKGEPTSINGDVTLTTEQRKKAAELRRLRGDVIQTKSANN
jgi:transposase-like protein